MTVSTNNSTPPDSAPSTSFGPTVAGTFYTSDPSQLQEQVVGYVREAQSHVPTVEGRLLGVIAPHAGYRYSGPVAGYAYSVLQKVAPKVVVVLGPSHHVRRAYACTVDVDQYRTPIGSLRVDRDSIEVLETKAPTLLRTDEQALRPEHSVDVQMPFLRQTVPSALVLPIVVPWMPRRKLHDLANLLFDRFGNRSDVVLVASSDLSHFYPNREATRIDQEIIREIEQRNTEELIAHHDERRGPCGVAPITVLFDYASHYRGVQVTKLRYGNSADEVAATANRVVGYGALAVSVPK